MFTFVWHKCRFSMHFSNKNGMERETLMEKWSGPLHFLHCPQEGAMFSCSPCILVYGHFVYASFFPFARSVTLQNGVPRSPRNSALWGMVTLSTLIPQTWPKWCTGILVNEGGYQWKSDFITSPGKLTFKMFLKFVSSQWAVLSACTTKFWQSMGGVWIAKKIRALLFFLH